MLVLVFAFLRFIRLEWLNEEKSTEGVAVVEHEVEEHSKGPHICIVAVGLSDEYFWRFVEFCAAVGAIDFVDGFAEAKVCKFEEGRLLLLFDEDVIGFNVSMKIASEVDVL